MTLVRPRDQFKPRVNQASTVPNVARTVTHVEVKPPAYGTKLVEIAISRPRRIYR